MSMAYPQPAQSKTPVVLVTIGVVVASLLELLVVLIGGGYLASNYYVSEFTKLDQLQQASARASAEAHAAAMRNSQQVANRPAPWSPPAPVRTSPPQNWPPPNLPPNNSPPNTSPPGNTSTPPDGPGTPYDILAFVSANDRVYILWGNSWWPGTVLEKRGSLVRIHYDNHGAASDEDVSLDRLRKMSPSDPKFRDGPEVTSRLNPGAVPATNTAALNPNGHRAPYNSRHQPQDQATREWRNRSGEVIFRGQLYGNFGPAVLLIQRSGFTTTAVSVDITILSNSDQAYVRGFPVLSPDRPDPTDPLAEHRAEMERRRQEMMDRINERRNGASGSPSTPPPAKPESIKGLRTWKDASGKFDLQAELIAVENGNVKLQRPDGKIVTMPIDKLSEADRTAVRAQYPE